MNNIDLLIGFASWEDRFRMGFSITAQNPRIRKALMFYYGSYENRTANNRQRVKEICTERCIALKSIRLDIDEPAKTWRVVLTSLRNNLSRHQEILIDISTMPREIIWYVLWAVGQRSVRARYIYHSPMEYGEGWLSKDPRAPRLVYKLSGIALPSVKTALLVTVGYDLQRVRRLINWFEPHRSIIGVQKKSRFTRNEQTMKEFRNLLESAYGCDTFELDAYSADRGLAAIRHAVEPLGSSHNILMSSLGPKLSAIPLYKIQRDRPEIGLVYAPSTQYNKNYSTGIGCAYEGYI